MKRIIRIAQLGLLAGVLSLAACMAPPIAPARTPTAIAAASRR
jgi:uncharacterized lipoprotein YajG